MELHQYWKIVRRHLWVVILLPLVALIAGFLFRPSYAPLYQATVRVTIGVVPPPNTSPTGEDLYNYELASEYLADDFSEVVKSGAFAQDVSHRLRTQGLDVQPGAIQGFTVAQKQHRILSIIITWPAEEEVKAIAKATITALEEESHKYFPQLGVAGAQLFVIDGPSIPGWTPVRLGPSLRERLDLPIRVVLGLIAGVGLAFLLDYFDDSIREAKEVEALGIPVLGCIPAPSIWKRLRHWRS